MNNYLILNEAISIDNNELFINGMGELIMVKDNKEDDDYFYIHSSTWLLPNLINLMEHHNDVNQAILRFLSQHHSAEEYWGNEALFDQAFPRCCNAYTGIDFSITEIDTVKQITCRDKHKLFKRLCYSQLIINDISDLRRMMSYLYPKYQFTENALEDLLFWNQVDLTCYTRIFLLLDDIILNPFQGGMGQTEVLKSAGGLCSKRINQEHRVTYTYENSIISIKRCRTHYQ